MKKYVAEGFGTFWLVLGGCGSAVLAAAFPEVGIGLAIGEAQDASIAMHADTMMWAIQLNQSEGVKIHFLSAEERENWKKEFKPKMVASVISKSEDPEKTRDMIHKTKELVKDLEWQ